MWQDLVDGATESLGGSQKNTKDALASYKTVHDLFEIKQCEKLAEDATTAMDKPGAWNGESLLLTLFQSTAFTPVERKKLQGSRSPWPQPNGK